MIDRTAVCHRRGQHPAAAALLLALLPALVLLVACGGSKAGPPPATSSAVPTAGSSSALSSGPAGTASGAASDDEAAIRAAYTNFLNPASSVDKSVSLLQDGEAFRSTLTQATTESLAKSAAVTVSKVAIDSADKATVTYSILLGGSPVLSNGTGYAVRENGRWKVAGSTFCQLLTLQITPPAACSQASATSLPG